MAAQKSKKITLSEVLDGQAKICGYDDPVFVPNVWMDLVNCMKMIHVSWVNREHLMLDDFSRAALEDAGNVIPVGTDSVWAYRVVDEVPKTNQMYVCNFRRYGWCESSRSDEGYNGIIYANVVDGGLECSTPEQVVRETLIAFMQRSNIPEEVKFHASMRPIWEALLQDAIRNISPHAEAPLKGVNGGCGRINITIS